MFERYEITVHSCKKDTKITMRLTQAEVSLLENVAKLTQDESKSDCQPTIHVNKVTTITVNGVNKQA